MKKILVAVALAGFASSAFAAVAGSKHDLRLAPYSGTFVSACMYCHTPHRATSNVAPIWARTDPATVTVTNVFAGGTISTRLSATCLTCHATAAGAAGLGGVTANLPATAIIDTNLGNDHPIGSAAIFTGVSTDGFVAVATFDATGFTLATNDAVECATCHDVHNTVVEAGSKLLRGYTGTDFCGTCHNK